MTDEWKKSSFRKKLSNALEAEHTSYWCSNSCDVHAAYANGYLLAAAWLLIGATEAPETESVVLSADVPDSEFKKDLKEFIENVPRKECSNCGTICYDVSKRDACGDCGVLGFAGETPVFLGEGNNFYCRKCRNKFPKSKRNKLAPVSPEALDDLGEDEVECSDCGQVCTPIQYTLPMAVEDER